MRYERTFFLQASHFNNSWCYERLWYYLSVLEFHVPRGEALRVMSETHGHNFKIVVTLEGEHALRSGWLVDDESLEKIVMDWNNINISTHKDFTGLKIRATTENMADVLFGKLRDKFQFLVKQVRVYETDQIYATTKEEV